MRFLSRLRRQPALPRIEAPHTPERRPAVGRPSLYDHCVTAAGHDHVQRLAELRVMRDSLELLGPFLLLLIDKRLALSPEALAWSEAERAITVDLTRLVSDTTANRRLIATMCEAGFEITDRTAIGPWYSVRIEHGPLAICVQGLSADPCIDDLEAALA